MIEMGKEKKLHWKVICGIITYLFLALSVSLDTSEATCCSDGLGLNYTLPMFNECKEEKHPNGSMVQTIPKLVPYSSAEAACPRRKSKLGIPPGHRVCRFPDCDENPCENGWCEETMKGYKCHCSSGFRGKHCDKVRTTSGATTDPISTVPATSPMSTCNPATTLTTTESSVPTGTMSASTLDSVSTSTPGSISDPPTTTESVQVDHTKKKSTTDPISETTAESKPSTSNPTTATESSVTTETISTSSLDSVSTSTPGSTSDPTTTTESSVTTETMAISTLDSASTPTPGSISDPSPTTESSAKMFVTDYDANSIFVADLQDEVVFTPIPTTGRPFYITYDHIMRRIYWSDWTDRRVHRANITGGNEEGVTNSGNNEPYGIAIAETMRILYIAYFLSNKITSMSIEPDSPTPGTETDFVTQGITNPRVLAVDEQQGYLYWTMGGQVARKFLNNTGNINILYYNPELNHLTGLDIDLTRDVRRIFFCDPVRKRTFYKDVSLLTHPETTSTQELTGYLQDPNNEKLRDVQYFNGVLYWVKANDPKGIGKMTDYDRTNRSYSIQEINQFENPARILVVVTES